MRQFHQPENIGSDANFVFCYAKSRGRYLWMCGDDDVIVPAFPDYSGALADLLEHLQQQEFDLIYVSSYGFLNNWRMSVWTTHLDANTTCCAALPRSRTL